jgi:hypothetical protein
MKRGVTTINLNLQYNENPSITLQYTALTNEICRSCYCRQEPGLLRITDLSCTVQSVRKYTYTVHTQCESSKTSSFKVTVSRPYVFHLDEFEAVCENILGHE